MKKIIITLLLAGLVQSLPAMAQTDDGAHIEAGLTMHPHDLGAGVGSAILGEHIHSELHQKGMPVDHTLLLKGAPSFNRANNESLAGRSSSESRLGSDGSAVHYLSGVLLRSDRGAALHADGGYLSQHSSYFHGSRPHAAFVPYTPGAESHARMTLVSQIENRAVCGGYTVKDPVTKQTWNLRIAHAPKLVKQANNTFVAQLPCYGTQGGNSQLSAVILQYSLTGTDPKWQVGAPTIVSAGKTVRPGQKVMAGVYSEIPANTSAFQTNSTQTNN